MASPRTEVILAPKIDRQDLNRVKESMNSAFDDVATKNRKELEKQTKKGVEDGLKQGSGNGVKYLKRGLIGLSAMVGAAALNALMGADEVIARMEQRLAGIRDIGKEAEAFGISSGEYAQVTSIFTALGYDQSDVRGLLSGFQAELEEPEMAKFKGIAEQAGVMQSMLSFIASTSGMTQTKRAARLKPLGDEDAVIASAIAAQIAKTGAVNLQELFTAMTGRSETAGQITKGIESGRSESDELAQYMGSIFIEDLLEGGKASQVIESIRLDRALEGANDEAIGAKLKAKEILVTAEIASIEAVSATTSGLESWIDNATNVLSNLGSAIKKTEERGLMGILEYNPWSTEPDRDKDSLLDLLMRGPFWDWMESTQSKDDQQDYTK